MYTCIFARTVENLKFLACRDNDDDDDVARRPRRGGWVVKETRVYDHGDDRRCRFELLLGVGHARGGGSKKKFQGVSKPNAR